MLGRFQHTSPCRSRRGSVSPRAARTLVTFTAVEYGALSWCAGRRSVTCDRSTRRDFFVYIDEFQSFTTLAMASMLSELRKYRVGFTIAHQYIHQLVPDIRHAVFGNVGSVISFRVGAEDAPDRTAV